MRTQDPAHEFQDGIELAANPAVEAPVAPRLPPHPRLCEAGPCRNYHQFTIQVDAETPRALRLPAGVLGGGHYQPMASVHVQTHHYCYPTVGIEMPLGDMPVMTCNQWDPHIEGRMTRTSAEERRAIFRASEDGVRYRTAVDEWLATHKAAQEEAAEMERLIGRHSGGAAP